MQVRTHLIRIKTLITIIGKFMISKASAFPWHDKKKSSSFFRGVYAYSSFQLKSSLESRLSIWKFQIKFLIKYGYSDGKLVFIFYYFIESLFIISSSEAAGPRDHCDQKASLASSAIFRMFSRHIEHNGFQRCRAPRSALMLFRVENLQSKVTAPNHKDVQ